MNLLNCSEAYEEEKSIIIVTTFGGEEVTFRISALKDLKTTNSNRYSTRVERLEHIDVQPTFPQSNGKFDRPISTRQVWVSHDHPWTNRSTAEEAINQALGFFENA